MELTTVQQILLIILTTALAVFLILAIVVAVMIIKLVKTLRMIADKAEKVVITAENVGEVFKQAATPLGVLRFVQGLVDVVAKHKKGKPKRGETS